MTHLLGLLDIFTRCYVRDKTSDKIVRPLCHSLTTQHVGDVIYGLGFRLRSRQDRQKRQKTPPLADNGINEANGPGTTAKRVYL